MSSFQALDRLCINTLRTLAIDAIQKADSGHPGLPLGAAPMAYVLWQRHLKHDPSDPRWPDRDRFVLSAGHGSMLLYGLLHLTGYELSMEDIQAFRQWGSKTPGHPEFGHTPGVEATTGPLGQGHANAVGMAIAERALAERFNRQGHAVVNHRTYALVSDGDVMEGVACEAASLAGHLGLGKLFCLYDANDVTLDGPAHITFSEDVAKRYEAYGWQVLKVERGDDDLDALDAALASAEADAERPSLIVVKTTIGFGSPHKAGTAAAHGSPLGHEEVALTKKALGWDAERKFQVPEDALKQFRSAVERGRRAHAAWSERFDAYAKAFPELAAELRRRVAGQLPQGWDKELPAFKAGEPVATRTAAGKALNAIAAKAPELMGGDADLSGSTNTAIKDGGSFGRKAAAGRNLHFGVREHGMGAIANGMAYHGGVRPYASTFFVFSDYMRPSVRLAALSGLPVLYVWTHDSIGLGEDGPTHQPVEQLMSLRAMPNLWLVRPADAAEAVEAWRLAMQRRAGPTGLVLARQKVPVLDRSKLAAASGLHRGAYVLSEPEGAAQALLIATGSEVQVALLAQAQLGREGIRARVVSMPCWEAFAEQGEEYRESVLPRSVVARVSIEAGSTHGWCRWIGERGIAIGVDRFGASAPEAVNFEKAGITAARAVEAVRRLLR
ncbi:MAG: transketolase [Myxococcales bacterium]|nr:transketolase [Myxococcales bacterium]